MNIEELNKIIRETLSEASEKCTYICKNGVKHKANCCKNGKPCEGNRKQICNDGPAADSQSGNIKEQQPLNEIYKCICGNGASLGHIHGCGNTSGCTKCCDRPGYGGIDDVRSGGDKVQIGDTGGTGGIKGTKRTVKTRKPNQDNFMKENKTIKNKKTMLNERFQELAGIKPLYEEENEGLKIDNSDPEKIKEELMNEGPELWTVLGGIMGVIGAAGITTQLQMMAEDPAIAEKYPKLEKVFSMLAKLGGALSKGIK